MADDARESRNELVEAARRALVDAALQAYEDAGLSGLCAEGRWEAAVSALRTADLAALLERPGRPEATDASSPG